MLVADSICKSFAGRRVLSSARLNAPRAQVVGLLGRMGTGKSTLLRICAGIDRPDSGWVELDGHRHIPPQRSVLASNGVFFLGESDNLAWTLTVAQHLSEIERRYGPFDRDEIFEGLDLLSLLDRKVSGLSGGEVKRVEMALAFARRPLVLLADEPFRNADPILCDLLGRSFRGLAGQGCAVVVTGHEVNMLMPFLDSVVWMTSGTTYALGPPDAARANDNFRREYLGSSSPSVSS